MNHVFYESSCKLQEALREVEKIDSITKDPSIYINQHFDDCHIQINSRRKSLIKDINDYSDKLIRENESNRSQCLQNSAKTEELAKKIDFSKEEIFDLKEGFYSFGASATQLRFEETISGSIYLKNRLSQTLKDYKESLLLNKELSFVCFYQPIEDIFGKMFDRNKIVECVTTDDEQLGEENLFHRNVEILSENVPLSSLAEHDTIELLDSPLLQLNNMTTDDGQLEYDEPINVLNNNDLVGEEIDNELPTQSEEQKYKKQVRQSSSRIEIKSLDKLGEHGTIDSGSHCQILSKPEIKYFNLHKKNSSVTIDGYVYFFKLRYRNKNKYYKCKNKKCLGTITLSPQGTIVRKRFHTYCDILKAEPFLLN